MARVGCSLGGAEGRALETRGSAEAERSWWQGGLGSGQSAFWSCLLAGAAPTRGLAPASRVCPFHGAWGSGPAVSDRF